METVIPMEYQRMESETKEDYEWRICHNKAIGLYDLTWDEVGYVINTVLDQNYSSSKYRKPYENGIKAIDRELKNRDTDDERYKKMELKRIEMKKESAKLSVLRNDINKIATSQSRFDLWVEQFTDAMSMADIRIPEYKEKTKKEKIDTEYVLTISDIHTGKRSQAIENYYDVEVMKDRMIQLRDETIEIIKEKEIGTLKILALGDLIDGLLRVSQIKQLEIGRADQVAVIMGVLIQWLLDISEHCKIDFYMTTSSNHSEGRPLGSQRGDFVEDDYEKLLFQFLKMYFQENERIEITGDNMIELDICGRSCLALHGHQYPKMAKQGANPLADINFHFNKDFQYMFMGHLHHTEIIVVGRNELGNKEIIKCPCIAGDDEYSDTLLKGSKAGALFMEFNTKQGRKTITDIILN